MAKKAAKKTPAPKKAAEPKMLSGGNPQIAKAYGDAPVAAYIAAMPDWKRDVGKRLDALITRDVPAVRKAVKWNSPFYGVEEGRWFLSFHVFTRHVKVAFFDGASLRPVPPGASKQARVRYLDIHEGELDEKQFSAWVKQASKLSGEKCERDEADEDRGEGGCQEGHERCRRERLARANARPCPRHHQRGGA